MRFPLLLLALLAALPANGQSLFGTVRDATDGSPLPGAHVFIDGTQQGDVVGDDGSFSLTLPERRPLVVVVSMVGFRLKTISITPRLDLSEAQDIQLEEDPVILGEFVVEAVKPRALRRLRGRVEDLLFSTTPAGSRCEFENPQALDIQNNGGRLDVRAREPVQILNPYLGYRITVHGMTLQGTQRFYNFTGRLQFEDLPAANQKVIDSRQERRERVYRGSRQHFLRSLVEGSLPESGFYAELVQQPGTTSGGDAVSENFGDARDGGASVLYGDPDDLTRSLMFTGALMVRYRRERPLPAYGSFLRSVNVQQPNTRERISWLELPTGIALLDRYGVPFADGSAPPLSHYGYWSWERVCDALPADWTP
ncbi:MAG: carboxypeptidase-like regulatory domain-containing protein [Rhodothermales bacterium]|nr:carboxypeptidase-like regulatory domain-containing protein [Rhodothermales bacterium]MBO6781511.1 carboxypeptidase-like regulatory domain-containing protein [Rhodothermales bacterium]